MFSLINLILITSKNICVTMIMEKGFVVFQGHKTIFNQGDPPTSNPLVLLDANNALCTIDKYSLQVTPCIF